MCAKCKVGWQATVCVLVLLLFGTWGTVVVAENWPMWRGPQRNGISQENDLPTKWSQSENVAWRLPLPGVAPSTPVKWGDRIFLTSTVRDREDVLLLCVDTAGNELWQRTIGDGTSEQAETNNQAAASPSTNGRHVWTMTGNGTVTCFDLDGKQLWQFNVEERYEKIEMPWGLASSPVPYGQLLYVQLFHLNSRRVIAIDQATGTEVWNHERETDAVNKCLRSYATPTIFCDDDQEYLLSHGQDFIVAHDLYTGTELWRCGDFHARSGYNDMMHVSSSPVVAEGLILVPAGVNGNFQVLRGNGRGEITGDADYRLWHDYVSPMRPSTLLVESLVYVCSEEGVLRCLDAQTGQEYYRRPLHRHTHYASPVYADGKIYFAARNGTVTVIAAGREFKILATNSLNETLCASPVFSDGRLYLRTFEALYAIK